MYDQIKTQLDTIAELGDEQVAELQADIVSKFEMVEGEDPTPETVDAMTSLADSLDIVRGELSRREALAAELATKAAEAVARVKGQPEAYGEEMAMTEDEPVEAPAMEETPEVEAPTEEIEVEVEAEEEDEKEEEMSIQASADESTETVIETSTETEASAEEVAPATEVTEEVTELSAESEDVATEASTDQEIES